MKGALAESWTHAPPSWCRAGDPSGQRRCRSFQECLPGARLGGARGSVLGEGDSSREQGSGRPPGGEAGDTQQIDLACSHSSHLPSSGFCQLNLPSGERISCGHPRAPSRVELKHLPSKKVHEAGIRLGLTGLVGCPTLWASAVQASRYQPCFAPPPKHQRSGTWGLLPYKGPTGGLLPTDQEEKLSICKESFSPALDSHSGPSAQNNQSPMPILSLSQAQLLPSDFKLVQAPLFWRSGCFPFPGTAHSL